MFSVFMFTHLTPPHTHPQHATPPHTLTYNPIHPHPTHPIHPQQLKRHEQWLPFARTRSARHKLSRFLSRHAALYTPTQDSVVTESEGDGVGEGSMAGVLTDSSVLDPMNAVTKLRVVCIDRAGLLAEIAQAIATSGHNIQVWGGVGVGCGLWGGYLDSGGAYGGVHICVCACVCVCKCACTCLTQSHAPWSHRTCCLTMPPTHPPTFSYSPHTTHPPTHVLLFPQYHPPTHPTHPRSLIPLSLSPRIPSGIFWSQGWHGSICDGL